MKKFANFLAVLVLAMVLLSFLSVLLRYLFNFVMIPMQELVLYLHACVFMLGIIYCYAEQRHVRIDIFYQKMSPKTQARINLLGVFLILVPLFAFIFYASWSYVFTSWQRLEGSAETGGLPFVYALKSLILILPLGIISYAVFTTLSNVKRKS